MRLFFAALPLLIVGFAQSAFGQSAKPYVIENGYIKLTYDLNGGHLISARLRDFDTTNPLSWALTKAQMPTNNQKGAPFRGHFLCFGRWGGPDSLEMLAGVPHNGDFNNQLWAANRVGSVVQLKTRSALELAEVSREIEVGTGYLTNVTEKFTNQTVIPRTINLVQHPTLGPPFLDEATRIFSNADSGFDQRVDFAQLPGQGTCKWPEGKILEGTTDLSRSDLSNGYVFSGIIKPRDTLGYILSYQPKTGLLFGYLWPRSDYPWVNIWNQPEAGRMTAKGIEFGTTGFGKPVEYLTQIHPTLFGQKSYVLWQAREQITRRYTIVMYRLPKSIQSIKIKSLNTNELTLEVLGLNNEAKLIPISR